jgi:hypothetical protein
MYWYNRYSSWWARGCSKHVEDWNKHIIKKNCASSWSFSIEVKSSFVMSVWPWLTYGILQRGLPLEEFSCNSILGTYTKRTVAFPLQQRLREAVSVLRYSYIAQFFVPPPQRNLKCPQAYQERLLIFSVSQNACITYPYLFTWPKHDGVYGNGEDQTARV